MWHVEELTWATAKLIISHVERLIKAIPWLQTTTKLNDFPWTNAEHVQLATPYRVYILMYIRQKGLPYCLVAKVTYWISQLSTLYLKIAMILNKHGMNVLSEAIYANTVTQGEQK